MKFVTRGAKATLAAALAIAANLVTIEAINYLNRIGERASDEVARSHAFVRLPPPEDPFEEPPPEEEEIEEEILELDLDPPDFQPNSSFELSVVDLELPAIPSVDSAVSVRTAMVVHSGPATDAKTAPMRSERVDQPPRELSSNPRPKYPRTALRKRKEGTVVVELVIDEEGRVDEYDVVSGDPLFVDEVDKVISRWRFTPPIHEGRAVKVRGRKSFVFTHPRRS